MLTVLLYDKIVKEGMVQIGSMCCFSPFDLVNGSSLLEYTRMLGITILILSKFRRGNVPLLSILYMSMATRNLAA